MWHVLVSAALMLQQYYLESLTPAERELHARIEAGEVDAVIEELGGDPEVARRLVEEANHAAR